MAKKGFCPECGVDLSDRDLEGHAAYHYPTIIEYPEIDQQAVERKAQILKGGVSKEEAE